jgi:hypothetical protein
MRSIKRRFDNQDRGAYSSVIRFGRAIRGQNFSKSMISRWMTELLELDDYSEEDRQALLKHYCTITRLPESLEDDVNQLGFVF